MSQITHRDHAHAYGTPHFDEECYVCNRFMPSSAGRDERSHVLPQRIQESRLAGKSIETLIDHIEFEQDRDPVRAVLGNDFREARAVIYPCSDSGERLFRAHAHLCR